MNLRIKKYEQLHEHHEQQIQPPMEKNERIYYSSPNLRLPSLMSENNKRTTFYERN